MNGCGTLCVPSCFGESHQVPGGGFIARRNGKQSTGLLASLDPEHTPRKDGERRAGVIPVHKEP